MQTIEQAIFTSAHTNRADGYQVVATSPGVGQSDARELAAWGPSHDALLMSAPNAVSFNFHPLPSGAYAISRTTPAGWEYEGPGGQRAYTQCLIVPPKVLARFANNPFALLTAALASGSLRVYDEIPDQLERLELEGQAEVVDSLLLERLAVNPGAEWMAAVVQAALDSVTVGLAGGPPAEHLIAGLLNCLPVPCRTEFSFSTGLKFSSRRPFRLVVLSGDREEQRRVERLYNLAVLDLSEGLPPEAAPLATWAQLIQRILKQKRTSLLAERFSQWTDVTADDLEGLGLELFEAMEGSTKISQPPDEPEAAGDAHSMAGSAGVRPASEHPAGGTPALPTAAPDDTRKAHAAHAFFQKSSSPATTIAAQLAGPSTLLDPPSATIQETLERLDDLVFAAVAGKVESLEQLKVVWAEVEREVDGQLLAESREQYLRYALSLWEQSSQGEGGRDTARAVQSLEVLCVLFAGA